jgi:maleate isomerase
VTGDRLTVGVITPHAAAGPDVELPAMTRGRLATLVFRRGPPPQASQAPSQTSAIAHAELRASTEPATLDRATAPFAGKTLAAVAHASTTCGYLIGHRQEASLVERLSHRSEVPAIASCAAAAAALRTHGVGRVHLVRPQRVIDWVEHHVPDAVEAIFLAGNGFRAAAALEELESRMGRLILEANQALLWGILATTGTGWDVTGHGRLLRSSSTT